MKVTVIARSSKRVNLHAYVESHPYAQCQVVFKNYQFFVKMFNDKQFQAILYGLIDFLYLWNMKEGYVRSASEKYPLSAYIYFC